jgi:hypothetical protein
MPVLDAVHTFAGIANENEFYSHHYLAEVFKGDIKSRLDAWDAPRPHPGHRGAPRPAKAPARPGRRSGLPLRGQVQRKAGAGRCTSAGKLSPKSKPAAASLGYSRPANLPPARVNWPPASPSRVAGAKGGSAQSLASHSRLPARRRRRRPARPQTYPLHYGGEPVPPRCKAKTWADMLSDAVFGAEASPALCAAVGPGPLAAAGPLQMAQQPSLRFDWADILDRKDADTLQGLRRAAAQGLPGPGEGNSLLESLDENAHKHAFGVSEDLKYALREAIELLGNEAAASSTNKPAAARRASTPASTSSTRPTSAWNACAWSTGCCSCSTSRPGPSWATCPSPRARSTSRATAWRACATWRCSRSTRRMRATAFTSTPPCAACSSWCRQGLRPRECRR